MDSLYTGAGTAFIYGDYIHIRMIKPYVSMTTYAANNYTIYTRTVTVSINYNLTGYKDYIRCSNLTAANNGNKSEYLNTQYGHLQTTTVNTNTITAGLELYRCYSETVYVDLSMDIILKKS